MSLRSGLFFFLGGFFCGLGLGMSQWDNNLTLSFFFLLHDTSSRKAQNKDIYPCCIYLNHMSSLFFWPHTSLLFLPSAPSIFDNKRQDPTGLTALLQSTDLVGVVHTLYCILLHSFAPESASRSQEPYGPGVIQVALQGIRFLNSFALLDLSAFQVFMINPGHFLFSVYIFYKTSL